MAQQCAVVDKRTFWFARVDMSVLMDESLDAFAKATYAVLCAYSGTEGPRQCFPSVKALSLKVGCSRARVFKSLDALEEVGVIQREKQTANAFQTVNRYVILGGNRPAEPVEEKGESLPERLSVSTTHTTVVQEVDDRGLRGEHGTRTIEPEPYNENIVGKSLVPKTPPLDEEEKGQFPPPCPGQKIIDIWNQIMVPLGKPAVRILSEARQSNLRNRWRSSSKAPDGTKEYPWSKIETWREYFKYITESQFLVDGRFCDFDWVIKKSNWIKIREGKYHQKGDCR